MPDVIYRFDGDKKRGQRTGSVITPDANDVLREVKLGETILLNDAQVLELRKHYVFSLTSDPAPSATEVVSFETLDKDVKVLKGRTKRVTIADLEAEVDATGEPYPFVHRGAGRMLARDNALSAMKLALQMPGSVIIDGGDSIQIADGTPVAMHAADANGLDLTTTSVGNPRLHTAMSWGMLRLKTAGAYGGPDAMFGSLANMPGPSEEAPPTIEEVLRTIATRMPVQIELKEPRTVEHCAAVVELVKRYGVEESVLINCFEIAALAPAVAAGIPTGVIADTEGAYTVQQIINSGASYYSPRFMTNAWNDAYLQQLVTAGIKIAPWYTNRRATWDAWKLRPGVTSICTDDPWYASRRNTPRDNSGFELGVYDHGMIPSDNFTRPAIAGGKMKFEAQGSGQWCLMGNLADEDNPPVTVLAPITFDALGSDLARWAGLAFGCPTDRNGYFTGGGSTGIYGYVAGLRANGSLFIDKVNNGVTAGAGYPVSLATAAVAAGATVPLLGEIRPDGKIRVTRTDTGEFVESPAADATYRGTYIWIGKSLQSAGSSGKMNVSFGNLVVTR